ncbi:MAG TPA: radical SAM protein [Syntrophales bacterium]|nr:radical SAM protein [Syntrophales bacterium]
MSKFALIHIGTHEVYGLCYVAGEIAKGGHSFRWFDGEDADAISAIADWTPDFICFSPLSAFFSSATKLSTKIKKILPSARSVFGGIHVSAVPEIVNLSEVDHVVIGPVDGTIEKIIKSKRSTIIKGQALSPGHIRPAKREYYEQIPRIGTRHGKMIMSHFGCVYNCSYCATHRIREAYKPEDYRRHWLSRRPLEDIIDEAGLFLECPTTEVELSDDDMLYGSDIETWLTAFAAEWKDKIGLPLVGNVTPLSVIRASDATMETLSNLVCNVCVGLQSSENETLRLFNRQFQTKKVFKEAVDRLHAFNIPVKIDIIIGNPVKDSIADAIETIKFAQTIGTKKVIATIFPLMLYPGTELTAWCIDHDIPLNEECQFNWYGGVGSVKFDTDTAKRLRNLTKLGSFFIEHNIPEYWMRALIEVNIDNEAAHLIAKCNFQDSLCHHGKSDQEIREILAQVNLYY